MVRAATEEDLESINRIENFAIENTFAHFGTEPIKLDETRLAFLASSGRYPWFVKEVQDQVVAFARASQWKARAAYRWTTEVGVYVDLAHQRQGIGRQLYEVLFPELQKLAFHTIMAGIALPNEASVRLHEGMGMSLVGTLRDMGFKFGAWHSVGYWAKVLDNANPCES